MGQRTRPALHLMSTQRHGEFVRIADDVESADLAVDERLPAFADIPHIAPLPQLELFQGCPGRLILLISDEGRQPEEHLDHSSQVGCSCKVPYPVCNGHVVNRLRVQLRDGLEDQARPPLFLRHVNRGDINQETVRCGQGKNLPPRRSCDLPWTGSAPLKGTPS